jgi:hypothetical protein
MAEAPPGPRRDAAIRRMAADYLSLVRALNAEEH